MAGRASSERHSLADFRKSVDTRELDLFNLFVRLTIQAGTALRHESGHATATQRRVFVRHHSGAVPLSGDPAIVAHLAHTIRGAQEVSIDYDRKGVVRTSLLNATYWVAPSIELRDTRHRGAELGIKGSPESLLRIQPREVLERPTVRIEQIDEEIAWSSLMSLGRGYKGAAAVRERQLRYEGLLHELDGVLGLLAPYHDDMPRGDYAHIPGANLREMLSLAALQETFGA